MDRKEKGMSARLKKINSNKVSELSPSRMADIWKIYRDKDLSESEREQFELIRKEYKKQTGRELPKNINKKD